MQEVHSKGFPLAIGRCCVWAGFPVKNQRDVPAPAKPTENEDIFSRNLISLLLFCWMFSLLKAKCWHLISNHIYIYRPNNSPRQAILELSKGDIINRIKHLKVYWVDFLSTLKPREVKGRCGHRWWWLFKQRYVQTGLQLEICDNAWPRR